jgi:putative DNA primase/helicase
MAQQHNPAKLLATAKDFARRGWAVFPITPGQKAPPATKNGHNDATVNLELIERWWSREPNYNIGIATGSPSGIWVLDVDGDAGEEALAGLVASHSLLPATVEAQTRRGRHIFFRHPGQKIQCSAGSLGRKLDVRGDGGYIVGAPSTHPDGGNYAWDVDHHPDEVQVADAPDWLLDLVVAPISENRIEPNSEGPVGTEEDRTWTEQLASEIAKRVADAAPGTRNDTLNKAAFELGQYIGADCLDQTDVEQLLLEAADPCGLIADDGERPVSKTIRSGLAAGIENPRLPWRPGRWDLTDVGNARRLVERHGESWRYCFPWKNWLFWDGIRWSKDVNDKIVERAKDTAAAIYEEAAEAGRQNMQKAEALGKWAVSSQSRERIRAMVELARSEIPIAPAELDKDPWALNVQNGTLDLRTGALRQHKREDLITKLAPVEFARDAVCPRFQKVVMDSANGDPDLAVYIQRHLGYALTGDTSEECLFFWHGTGRNGKGTIAETVRAAMGDYAATTPAATLTQADNKGPRNDLAALKGIRIVLASEVNEGRKLDEALVKSLTGGDNISARFLFGEWFEYRPEYKVVLQTNYRPRVRGVDEGIWSRIRLVPFDHTVPEQERDKGLKACLLQHELPGVLNWLLEGCLDWQRRCGLDEPGAVRAATQTYREQEDTLADFLAGCTVTAQTLGELPVDVVVPCGELLEACDNWSEQNGLDPVPRWLFRSLMTARGFHSKVVRSGQKTRRVYEGIRLRGTNDPAANNPRLALVRGKLDQGKRQ